MLILSREQTTSRSTCVVQLEGDEKYNEQVLLNVCFDASIPRCSSVIDNIPRRKGRYKVSIKTAYEPYDDFFAKMYKEYGEGFI